MTTHTEIDLNNLLQQARNIRPDVRHITVMQSVGELGGVPAWEFYAHAGQPCTVKSVCFAGDTPEELLKDIRSSVEEAA
jgi:hypothetical protein